MGTSQVVLVVKNTLVHTGDMRCRFDPWVGKIPWSRAWQPTLVYLAWRFPWTEKPVRLQDTTEATACMHTNNYDKLDCSDCLLGNFEVILVSYSSCLLFGHWSHYSYRFC